MTDSKSKPFDNQTVLSVIAQLNVESEYLDSVIESSLEMQNILRERRAVPVAKGEAANESELESPGTSLLSERNQRLDSRITQLRSTIETNFVPVIKGRRVMVEALVAVAPNAESTPTISEIAADVDEPLRGELKRLRTEIRRKLNEVHSISMGNQAVLLYTLDFYNRLLSGLSSDTPQAGCYNAAGRTESHVAGSIVRTNC